MFWKKKKERKMKKWEWILLLLIVVFSLSLKIYHSQWPKENIVVAGQELHVLVADTQQHQYKGWSDRKDMGKYDGMIFVMGNRGQHTMVMRDMHFPIDILWVDGSKIVDMAPNVQPESDKGQLRPYFSRLPSNMVLELKAGFIKAMKNHTKNLYIIKCSHKCFYLTLLIKL